MAKDSIVVANILDVHRFPVDGPAGPLNRAGRVRGRSAGPERELDSRRCLREVPALRCFVPCVLAVLYPADLAVNQPGNGVRGPYDLVVVEVIKGIGQANIGGVAVYTSIVSCMFRSVGKVGIKQVKQEIVCIEDSQTGLPWA